MTLETGIQLTIYIHAFLGGIAFLAGTIALIVTKGSTVHKKAGLVFYYSLLISVLISLVISVLPEHTSTFLFTIGLLSIYFLISGRRNLKWPLPDSNTTIDKGIAILVVLISITMIACAFLLYENTHMILLVFGIGGLLLSCRDLYTLSDQQRILDNWLPLHMGKMTGGYIAAITALFVVNEVLPGNWNWYAPSIVGGLIIVYWRRKIKAKNNAPNTGSVSS